LTKLKTENEKLVELMQRACAQRDTMKMLTSADELLRREPANVDAMFVAGTAFLQGGQEGLAALTLNAARCATKDPNRLGAIWSNIGVALHNYQPEEAYRAFKEALKYGEAPASMYDNLCNVASQIGRHAEALDWSDKAGDGLDSTHNRAFALLHMGRWEEAWPCYAGSVGTEVRPKTERTFDLPRWKGQKGKVIIHGEQGVGDEIMFMSMCPADFDGVIECSPRMEGLFARSFPKASVYGTLLQNYLEWPLKERADYHIEMGGLGEFYAPHPIRLEAFLAADKARRAAWSAWLAAAQGDRLSHGPYRVGIAWTGGTWATGRAKRSIPWEIFRDKLIAQHPDITFVNLEYEDRTDELADHPDVLNPYWATKKGADMDDLAALVSSLDLVITATNSTVDVAGALGVPTWALVPHNPPWRYSEVAGENEMWFYESVRTFRQNASDKDWVRVLNNVTTALHQMKLKAAA
jgi:hypothetical protein